MQGCVFHWLLISWYKEEERGVPTTSQTFVLMENPGLCSFQQQVINENYHLSNGNNAIIPKGKAVGAQSICRKLEQRRQGSPGSLGLYPVTGVLRCPFHPAPCFQALEPKSSNSQPGWRLGQFWGDSGVLQQLPSLLQQARVEEVA